MRRVVLALLIALLPSLVAAQDHHALTAIRPLAVGAAGTGLDADNRIYRAYAGVTYTIRADATGGEWPYTFSLSGEPSGMTVVAGPCTTIGPSCTAGTITWTNPLSTDSSITVRISDKDGDFVDVTWGVTVSTNSPGAGGYCFINEDTGNDTTGSGTLASPWRTIDKAYDSCGARSILYFVGNGPFNLDGVPIADSTSECDSSDGGATADGDEVNFSESARPTIWLDYPDDGLTPVLDIGHVDGVTSKPCIAFTSDNTWVQGLDIRNCALKCFEMDRTNRFGVTTLGNTFNGTGAGQNGMNSAVIMHAQRYGGGGNPPDTTPAYFDYHAGNTFTNVQQDDGMSCVKLYSSIRGVVAYNSFDAIESSECVALKSDVSQFTVRANTFEGITGTAIGGNYHEVDDITYGEVLHNLVADSSTYAMEFNQDGQSTIPSYYYRNTFIGAIHARNIDSADGPFTFTNNVIVNDTAASGSCPAKYTCTSVTDYSRLVRTDNLDAATTDGAVDGSGNLAGSYRTSWLGTRGYELQASGVTGPTRLRIRGEN